MAETFQQGQQSDGSRSRTGCITCRIRKKKCDEQRPACQACCSRQLACYGFDTPPPSWYTNKASWTEIRDSDEAKSLRTSAETRYKISRKIGSASEEQDLKDRDRRYPSFQSQPRTLSADSVPTSPSSVLMRSGVNIWQLRPESLWWDSKIRSLIPDPDSSSRDETRLLMLFIDVIHPITHTFYKLSSSKDRSWMLDRLVSKRSLYCSALSISACFDHSLSQPPSINDIGIYLKVRNLQSRAICDLRNEIDEFSSMRSDPAEEFVWAGIQILAVVIHLQTLEIFSMLGGCWEMHHHAARRILNHIEIHGSAARQESGSDESVIGAMLLDLSPDSARRRSLNFCLCGFIWLDVLATSTFGAFSYGPCAFDYLELLETGVVNPGEIMGCKAHIMALVSRISRLEQWRVEHRGQSRMAGEDAILEREAKLIVEELNDHIDSLERDSESTENPSLKEDIRLISIIWAYGAQVLLQATVLEPQYDALDIDQRYVDACLQKLEALPTRLVMRTTWPYTIAGSMATDEAQQTRFRRIFGKVMQEAQPPGVSWKGLMVMEETWRLRRSQRDRRIGWREGMEKLGVRVILT